MRFPDIIIFLLNSLHERRQVFQVLVCTNRRANNAPIRFAFNVTGCRHIFVGHAVDRVIEFIRSCYGALPIDVRFADTPPELTAA